MIKLKLLPTVLARALWGGEDTQYSVSQHVKSFIK